MERTHEKTEAEGYDHPWRLFLVSGLHTEAYGRFEDASPHRTGTAREAISVHGSVRVAEWYAQRE